MFVIYQITNKINQNSYIGVTSRSATERWKEHQRISRNGSMLTFSCAIRKYGADNFLLETLEEGWDPEIGREIREPYWISVLKPEYNETDGGEGTAGFKRDEEQKRKMRGNQNARGSKRTTEQLLAQAISQRGKKRRKWYHFVRSAEDKSAISERLKGNKHTEGHSWDVRQIVCPHCQKIGGANAMNRWHFNNCKRRK